jgi:hypothetical protein
LAFFLWRRMKKKKARQHNERISIMRRISIVSDSQTLIN